MDRATQDGVSIENMDVDMEGGEVGGLMMTIIKEEKSHKEVVREELQNQCMIIHMSNATTVRS